MDRDFELPSWPLLILGLLLTFVVILPLYVVIINWRISIPVILLVIVWITWPG
jgi:hypothetical protein